MEWFVNEDIGWFVYLHVYKFPPPPTKKRIKLYSARASDLFAKLALLFYFTNY